MEKLNKKKCKLCEGGVKPLTKEQVEKLLRDVSQWEINAENNRISRTFTFKNFFRTMSFANAVAWIANNENHHPDMEISFDRCTVHFTTHAIKGLSENDFICAAKIDNLFDEV